MTRTLYAGGTVVTNPAALPVTDAIAVADGRVVAIGDEARGWSADWDEVVDLRGRCVVPGFRDGHAHPVHAGEELVEHVHQAPHVGLGGLGRAGAGEERPGERVVEEVDPGAVAVGDLGALEAALGVGDVDHR